MRYAVGREVPAQALIVDGVKVAPITEAYIGAPPSMGLVAHELAHLTTFQYTSRGGRKSARRVQA